MRITEKNMKEISRNAIGYFLAYPFLCLGKVAAWWLERDRIQQKFDRNVQTTSIFLLKFC